MLLCLALNIYFEARNQPVDGQMMVAEVTMELAAGGDVCEQVWKPGVFTWTQDGRSDTPKEPMAWLVANWVAADLILNGCQFCTGATHYHNTSVDPYWASEFTMVGMVGDHIFYVDER